MDEFFRSPYGRRYFEHQLPALIEGQRSFTEAAKRLSDCFEKVVPVMTNLAESIGKLEEAMSKMDRKGAEPSEEEEQR
jgi:type II secretory pathway component PulF